jgi:prevent-host-death family protein
MTFVGLRELRQRTKQIVERAGAGELIVVTDQGRPVAQLTQISASPYQRMLLAGEVKRATGDRTAAPMPAEGSALTPVLEAMRQEERW